jgi:hypothetical protein
LPWKWPLKLGFAMRAGLRSHSRWQIAGKFHSAPAPEVGMLNTMADTRKEMTWWSLIVVAI